MRSPSLFLLSGLLALAASSPVIAQTPPANSSSLPLVVAGPPTGDKGVLLRELFEQPDAWKDTRANINALLTNDWGWGKIPDNDVRKWMGQLHQWNLPLELETGAVKEWGGQTGKSTFDAERGGWDRIQSLGGTIHSIAQDEPLCNVRFMIKKDDDYAVNETASFISLVRQNYPDMQIGDIEPYPSLSVDDHMKWIDALQAKLASMNVKGLDFYRVDVDWNAFNIAGTGHWKSVKKIQDYCKTKGIPFSLIYWASDYPAMKSKNLGDDFTWYIGTMGEGYSYAGVNGKPDQYCIESWVDAPSHNVPDNLEFTFMNSTKDFINRFVLLLPPKS